MKQYVQYVRSRYPRENYFVGYPGQRPPRRSVDRALGQSLVLKEDNATAQRVVGIAGLEGLELKRHSKRDFRLEKILSNMNRWNQVRKIF